MKSDEPVPGGLYRHEFLDKGLVTYAECVNHYNSRDPDALLEDMRLLFSPTMLAIPLALAGARYFALMAALIRCTAKSRDLDPSERAKFVNICIDVCTYLQTRTVGRQRDRFIEVLSWVLDDVALTGVFPGVAASIVQAVRPSAGLPEATPLAVRERRPRTDDPGGRPARHVA